MRPIVQADVKNYPLVAHLMIIVMKSKKHD